jgi:SOS-response transcriptional repressor LexA
VDERNKTTADLLRRLLKRADMKLDRFARAVGYKRASSVQRYLDPGTDREWSVPLVRRFARALIGLGNPPITARDFLPFLQITIDPARPETEAALYEILQLPLPGELRQNMHVIPAPIERLTVKGFVRAGTWMEPDLMADEAKETLAVTRDERFPGQQYALRVVGTSMDKYVSPGAYVICEEYGTGSARLRENAVVHVERIRHQDGNIEWTLKRVHWIDGRCELWPDSTDPRHQKPVVMGEDPEAEVHVRGVVIARHLPEGIL